MSTILIVEDESDVAMAMQLSFQVEGITATVASNGADALKLLGSIAPDLIVSDAMMPGMSGAEFCSAVRSCAAYEDILIIVTSALSEAKVREQFQCYDAYLRR